MVILRLSAASSQFNLIPVILELYVTKVRLAEQRFIARLHHEFSAILMGTVAAWQGARPGNAQVSSGTARDEHSS
jgi:hypothetical protein